MCVQRYYNFFIIPIIYNFYARFHTVYSTFFLQVRTRIFIIGHGVVQNVRRDSTRVEAILSGNAR